jgi:hypothetical protein
LPNGLGLFADHRGAVLDQSQSRSLSFIENIQGWLTDKSFNLFRQSLAEQSFAGINPDVARFARHVWVLESFVSQPVFKVIQG